MAENSMMLIDFILQHCTYLRNNTSTTHDDDLTCPICLTHLLDSTHHIIQIDLASCQHSFDADCLSRYVLEGCNNCPLCRATWYDIPEGALTGRTTVGDGPGEGLGRLFEALLRLDIVVREADLIDDEPDGEGTQEQQQQVDERLQRIEQLLETGFGMLPEEVDMEALEAEIDDAMNGLDAETRDGD
jgi:hypothetical protein